MRPRIYNRNSARRVQRNTGNAQPFFQPAAAEGERGTEGGFFAAAPTVVQAQLTVGQPGDRYEQEADAMADRVVGMSPSNAPAAAPAAAGAGQGFGSVQRSTPKEEEKVQRADIKEEEKVQRAEMKEEDKIQRAAKPEEEEQVQRAEMKEEEKVQRAPQEEEKDKPMLQAFAPGSGGGTTVGPSMAARINSSRGGGSPLPAPAQQEMSSSFGYDFSTVRIHTDSEAASLSDGLGAQAFTLGREVYFNQGKFNPDTRDGKRLLAHELTHVVQQGYSVKPTSIVQLAPRKKSKPKEPEESHLEKISKPISLIKDSIDLINTIENTWESFFPDKQQSGGIGPFMSEASKTILDMMFRYYSALELVSRVKEIALKLNIPLSAIKDGKYPSVEPGSPSKLDSLIVELESMVISHFKDKAKLALLKKITTNSNTEYLFWNNRNERGMRKPELFEHWNATGFTLKILGNASNLQAYYGLPVKALGEIGIALKPNEEMYGYVNRFDGGYYDIDSFGTGWPDDSSASLKTSFLQENYNAPSGGLHMFFAFFWDNTFENTNTDLDFMLTLLLMSGSPVVFDAKFNGTP